MVDFGMLQSQFVKDYREKNFYLHCSAIAQDSINWNDINHILYCTEPKAPYIRLHRDGFVPEEQFTESYSEIGLSRKRILKNVFYEQMRQGATLIFNRIEAKSPFIQQLCMEVAKFSEGQTVANAYLAFCGNGSFGNHWDTHDVFVFQMLGRKRWKIWKPTCLLPLPLQTSKDHKEECPAEPVFDGILEAGDMLYIPRGWWHNALPLEEETFHLAIGVYNAHIVDYVGWVCANLLPRFIECRKAIRPGTDSSQDIDDAAEVIRSALLDPRNVADFSRQIVASERVVSPFAIEKFGRQRKEELAAGTILKLNSSYVGNRACGDIIVNGFRVKLNASSASVVATIAQASQISAGELAKRTALSQEQLGPLVYELASRDLIEIVG